MRSWCANSTTRPSGLSCATYDERTYYWMGADRLCIFYFYFFLTSLGCIMFIVQALFRPHVPGFVFTSFDHRSSVARTPARGMIALSALKTYI